MKRMFGCGNMESTKKIFLTKSDVLLLAGILMAAFLLLLLRKGFRQPGSQAVVSRDGRAILQVQLLQEVAAYYLVMWEKPHIAETRTAENGGSEAVLLQLSPDSWEEEAEALLAESGKKEYNLFACENGEVRMIRSSCPDLICVKHQAVSGTGESIICLPHKLIIEISDAQEKELDGVVY